MKVNDLVKRYEADPKPETAGDVLYDLMKEYTNRASKQRAKSVPALVSVLEQLDRFWRLFVARFPGHNLNRDGFVEIIAQRYPNANYAWQTKRGKS